MKNAILRALAFVLALFVVPAVFAASHVRAVAINTAHQAHDALFRGMARMGLVLFAADTVPLNPFTNVVASGIAICDLRSLFGYTVDRIQLQLGGGAFTKAMITSIQLKANGKVIFDSTGSATDSRMTFRGITANASFLTLDFLELKARTKLGLMAGGLDTTIGIKDLRLEVTIAGATTPTLIGYAEVSLPQLAPEYANLRPLIARVHRVTQSIGAAGTFPLQVPHLDPNSGGSIFKRIMVLSANMTGGRVERNGIKEWEVLSTAYNNFQLGEHGRSTVASLFPLDFIKDGLIEDRVLDTRPAVGVTTAAVYGIFSGAETITIEAEVLEPLDVY